MAYRILILLLASKVHEVEKLKWKIKRLKEIVDKMEIETVNILIEGPYSSINNALEKLKENSSIGGIIIYCLTGGTSKIAYEISGKCNAPLWLMADESDNSLPSTINLREKVRRIGRIAKIIYLNEPIERIYRKLETFNRVVNTFDLLRRSKILIIGRKDRKANNRLNLKFKCIEIENKIIENELNRVTGNEIEKAARKFEKLTKKKITLNEKVEDAIKLYIAFKKLIRKFNCTAITVDCFRFIEKYEVTPCLSFSLLNSEKILSVCEGEMNSYLAMMIASSVSDKPVFMGNMSSYDMNSNTVILAHCTAPLTIPNENVEVTSHFETGKSIALDVKFKKNNITLLSIDEKMKHILVEEGRILESSLKMPDKCRTQVKIKINRDVEEYVNALPGNHQILVLGNRKKTVEEIAESLKLKLL